MMTLSSVQIPSFQTASGYCTTSADFLGIVNQIIPRLANRGDWPGWLLPIRVCVRQGCVTWPRYVNQIRKANTCRHTVRMRNVFYEWLDYQGPRHLHAWQSWLSHERNLVAQFRAPFYSDIFGLNSTIRVVPMVQADIGKTVTFFGTDTNNQPLRTNNGDGTWSEGITVAAALPFGSTSTFIGHIDRTRKDLTQGNLLIYGYDSVQNAMYDLAVYEPSELNPSYLRNQLDGGHHHGQSGCNTGCQETIIALVKLKFIPVMVPSDGLIFLDGSEGALLHAIRAVKREEAGDPAGARGFWTMAVEELNRQLEDFSPDDSFSAVNNVFAGKTFRNKCF